MYNIKKAVSRLDFAPKLEAVDVFDVKRGLGKFTPKADKSVSFSALRNTLKKSGYKLDSAEISVTGTLAQTDAGWWLDVEESKQRFALAGSEVEKSLAGLTAGARVQIVGDWQTVEQGATKGEIIRISAAQKLAFERKELYRPFAGFSFKKAVNHDGVRPSIALATLLSPAKKVANDTALLTPDRLNSNASAGELSDGAKLFLAPIRTTSPGLTVYKGGGISPRYFYTKQHLGNLDVERHALKLAVTYTPTPTLQLEIEAPYTWTSFDNGLESGSGTGFGNVTVWGKYRFYRTLETWGDKQAAFRFGVELPTGKKTAPGFARLNAPDFLRQQLTPINSGWAAHFDTSFSQAHKRLIYGANLEATARGERDGFRMGHEIRLNTDLEYVLLPFNYRSPTKELFVILETTYLHHGQGRLGSLKVSGSSSDEFYVAPGLQYIASPRFVIEASFQFSAILHTSALILKTDRNFLFGVRYLY